MHLYFIRHGESDLNLGTWSQGNQDTALTARGRRQAELVAAWAAAHLPPVSRVFASTMRRARETAAEIARALGSEISFDDRLREIGANRRDHTAWSADEIPRRFAGWWRTERPYQNATPSAENGESWMHFRIRVGAFLEDVVASREGDAVLIVTHAGVVDATFDHVFNVGGHRRCEVRDDHTGVSHFEHVAHPNREAWRLHYHNRQAHLAPLVAEEADARR